MTLEDASVSKGPGSLIDGLRRESTMWLSDFLGALTGAGRRVLEVGCGPHFADAAVLAQNGLNVFACDLNLPQGPRAPLISAFVGCDAP